MKRPIIREFDPDFRQRRQERGVTIILVALTMVAIMAMAALSIDVVTLYLANAEAQRAADTAALAGARVLSLSGITGDPNNDGNGWTAACNLASQVATAVATQNTMGNAPITPGNVSSVTFLDRNGPIVCTENGAVAFGVNPEVQVKIQRTDLPTFFARIWGAQGSSVSATATAEVYNSSDAKDFSASGIQVPVRPHCVKPWVVPNLDPGNSPNKFVAASDGDIQNKGVLQLGGGAIGETFNLFADCGTTAPCGRVDAPPTKNVDPTKTINTYNGNPPPPLNNLEYLPGDVPSTSAAVPTCGDDTDYQKAVAGCDDTTVYKCGVPLGNTVDLSVNPGGNAGDTATAVQCMIHQATQGPAPTDADSLDTTAFPFKITAGTSNPMAGAVGSVVTTSNSIVTVPIYDSPLNFGGGNTSTVSIVGFLQVFINYVATDGSLNVTVLNVTGCGNTGASPVTGTSPVPIRLVTNQ